MGRGGGNAQKKAQKKDGWKPRNNGAHGRGRSKPTPKTNKGSGKKRG
jgi:hypothetical protein